MKFDGGVSRWLCACLAVGLTVSSIILSGCGGEETIESEPAPEPEVEGIVAEVKAVDTGDESADPSPSQAASEESVTPTNWRELWDAAAFGQLVDDADYHLANGSEGVRESIALTHLFLGNRIAAQTTVEPLPEDAPLRVFLRALESVYEDPSQTNAQSLADTLASWEAEKGSQEEQWMLNARGFALSELGMRAESFQSFVQCVKTWPENAVALRNLARSYRIAQMPEFAVSTLKQWVKRHVDSSEARAIYSQTLLDLGHIEEAQAFADTTYARLPDDPEVIANLARVYLLQGDSGVAEQLLGQTATERPDDTAIQVLLASAQLRNGHAETALKTLGSIDVPASLRLSAAKIEAFAQMDAARFAEVVAALNQFDATELSVELRFLKAAARIAANESAQVADDIPDPETTLIFHSNPSQVLSGALGLSTDFADAADGELAGTLRGNSAAIADFAYAVACYFSAQSDKSYALFESIVERVGDNPRLAGYALSALIGSHDVRGLSGLADATVKQYSDNSELWMIASVVHAADDNDVAQRSALDRAIEVAPEEMELVQRRANLAIADGDDALALTLFERAYELAKDEELTPNIGSTLNNISYFITKMGGDLAVAIDHANKALEALPNSPNVLHTLGWAQLKSGLLEDAGRNLSLALQQRPGDPTITLDYGQLLIAQGKEKEGLARMRAAIRYADELGIIFPRREEAVAALAEAN